jgi:D-3-phosphoglycerate dehydrogenase
VTARVLVAEALAPTGLDAMRAAGLEVDVRTGMSHNDLLDAVVGAAALVIRSETLVDESVLEAGRDLVVVGRAGIGLDNVDVEAATRRGVMVVNAPQSNVLSAAEHTIALLLAQARNVPQADADLKAGVWNRSRWEGVELHGKTLGIVGLGNIGKKVARLAHAFNMNVLYYDVARLTEDQEDALGVRFVLFTELLQAADIVSLHVPLDESTRNLIGARELGMMKKTAILINTCRGPVVDEAALHKALTSGQILAAGLDVLVEEPAKPNHPLYGLKNVTLTPHSAGPTWENWSARFRNGFDNIQRVASGRPAKWVIPELLTPPGM